MRGKWVLGSSWFLSWVLAGCGVLPTPRMTEGTYLQENDPASALIVYRDRVEVHVPTARDPEGHGMDYHYDMSHDGQLHLVTASARLYQLFELDCLWYWTNGSIECRRENGNHLRFVRAPANQALAPVTEEQRVWLAVARHLRARGPVTIHSRTAFASRWGAVDQLRDQARRKFCGNNYDDARGILAGLKRLSGYHDKSLQDALGSRAEFTLDSRRPAQGGAIGLSVALFAGRDDAYVSVDFGGREGAILRIDRRDGEWRDITECARWRGARL